MGRARCREVELEYVTYGNPADPPIVLIIGFTSQLVDGDDGFCELLAAQHL